MSTQASIVTQANDTTSFLQAMQSIIKDYLYRDEWFLNFAIITEDQQNAPDQLDMALQGLLRSPNGKAGLSILIHTLRGGGSIPNAPMAYSTNAEALFLVVEMPAINRLTTSNGTGIKALVLAETLIAVMKNFASTEIATNFREPDTAQSPPVIDNETGLIIHAVKMLFHGGITDTTAVVAKPVITIDPITCIATITCATAGSAIYYTTDGLTRPTTSGTLFSGPFNATGLGYVWARAYLAGSRASLIATATVPATVVSAPALSDFGLTFSGGDIGDLIATLLGTPPAGVTEWQVRKTIDPLNEGLWETVASQVVGSTTVIVADSGRYVQMRWSAGTVCCIPTAWSASKSLF